ncbi:hypothetical protein U3A58_12555 [Algoriphagus sp. C2-6-M1]|uniref:hypothetical protein n=1 Tax=Algoriphagus persicinus TaxID=3108754 RepID=UPI002B3754E6|nr:hypothetical protein [Algoriphagus sp. C2-6-M1]MEB2781227.1 hypothetical protein [Algoriphagus sp. C2-6-M1]
MKSIYFIVARLLVTSSACAQGSKALELVKKAFSLKFTAAKKVTWHTESATEWEAIR